MASSMRLEAPSLSNVLRRWFLITRSLVPIIRPISRPISRFVRPSQTGMTNLNLFRSWALAGSHDRLSPLLHICCTSQWPVACTQEQRPPKLLDGTGADCSIGRRFPCCSSLATSRFKTCLSGGVIFADSRSIMNGFLLLASKTPIALGLARFSPFVRCAEYHV